MINCWIVLIYYSGLSGLQDCCMRKREMRVEQKMELLLFITHSVPLAVSLARAVKDLAVSLTPSLSSNKRVYTIPCSKMLLSHSTVVRVLSGARSDTKEDKFINDNVTNERSRLPASFLWG